eukprot:CAMPEP_0204196090 /NCGR_PEP_ID=MMETSP0361-20130328/63578_1 /ASSEMBLY_ACC=CAM_ASM_000343 /TAXON_ID=268821 /ORGANISM="Scrippsiella Hangoei, Strain SHTV-5" /LENGTH=56 /DNA_ID=CAMNT_0051157791 /DNA_START=59 /DNA_END=226 /DNA_ORIENTATION=-
MVVTTKKHWGGLHQKVVVESAPVAAQTSNSSQDWMIVEGLSSQIYESHKLRAVENP